MHRHVWWHLALLLLIAPVMAAGATAAATWGAWATSNDVFDVAATKDEPPARQAAATMTAPRKSACARTATRAEPRGVKQGFLLASTHATEPESHCKERNTRTVRHDAGWRASKSTEDTCNSTRREVLQLSQSLFYNLLHCAACQASNARRSACVSSADVRVFSQSINHSVDQSPSKNE